MKAKGPSNQRGKWEVRAQNVISEATSWNTVTYKVNKEHNWAFKAIIVAWCKEWIKI